MFGQVATLLHYRFIMMRRIWFRTASGQMAGVLLGLFTLLLALLGLAMAAGMYFAGSSVLSRSEPLLMLTFMDVVLFVLLFLWSVGVLTELQRSDALDFRKMLYLPVSLRMVFLLNFVASLATPIFPVFVLGALGLTLGLLVGEGPAMLATLPLAAAFFLMLAAWTYCFRGWLGALMDNKRRRRLILTVVPLAFVVMAQLPGLATGMVNINSIDKAIVPPAQEQQSHELDHATARIAALKHILTTANAVLPPGWLALGMNAAQQRDFGTAALCFLGMTLLGSLGLAAGYRGTYRHYMAIAKPGARGRKDQPRTAPGSTREPFTGRCIPGLSDDTAAVACASWLTAMRHPAVRIQMLMPFFFAVIFLLPMMQNHGHLIAGQTSPMIGAILFMILAGFAMFLFNLFGMDPEGFQAFILLPTMRQRYLLGKNIAFFPIVAALFMVIGGVVAILTRPAPTRLIMVVLQLVQVYVSLCLVGNFLSILFPYRMRKDSMNASNSAQRRVLGSLVALLLMPIVMLPSGLLVAADVFAGRVPGLAHVPVGVIGAAVLLVLTVAVYYFSLGPAGRLLQSREMRILSDLRYDSE